MNKRGELFVIGAIVLLVITSLGAYKVYSISNKLYIGNTETLEYLDYFKCSNIAKSIPDDKVIVFKSQTEAINNNYNATIGCV